MSSPFHPALIFIVCACVVPFLKGPLKSLFILAVPVLGFLNVLNLEPGNYWQYSFFGYELVFGRVDGLSLMFSYIYHIVAFIGLLYMLNCKNNVEYMSGMAYGGAALGVVFAGDLFSFFIFWELLTIPAVLLVLERKTEAAYGAGLRYVLVHVLGGLLLFSGILLHVHETNSIAFNLIGLGSLGSYLIFFGFGINCAWPFLHSWLPDAYPEATVGGAVFMSALTTKTAVYALTRGFAGQEALIWIGTCMAVFPIFYAVIENDLRRVLSYSLINQVGFMVVGIGIGTSLSLNGTTAHVFTHILYKALLFMSIGAVIHQTGKSKATELGGLYKSMPFTCVCCIIGAASISAFPLFSGFVSKSMVMTAAAEGHLVLVWFLLLFAAAGVFHHAGIKIPFFAFFSHDSGIRVKEAPLNMLIAMGIAAFLCVFIGIFPNLTIYPHLPFEATYEPYTFGHVLGQTQLLCFSALAFCLLLLSGVYPAEIKAINIDADWVYRKGVRAFYGVIDRALNGLNEWCYVMAVKKFAGSINGYFIAAPAKLACLVFTLLWKLQGIPAAEIEAGQASLHTKFAKDSFRLGITSGFAVLFLFVLLLAL